MLCKSGILRTEPAVSWSIAQRYDHFLLDEFQDLSPVQLRIVKHLWSVRSTTRVPFGMLDDIGDDAPSLLVVGDDNQAIFGWRSGHHMGTQSAISAFSRVHPGTRTMTLSTSFRCGQAILDAAMEIIASQPAGGGSPPLLLRSKRREQGNIFCKSFDRSIEEVQWTVDYILNSVEGGRMKFSDIAVLARHNSDVGRISEHLRVAGVPVHSLGGTRLYSHPRITELMHLLAAIVRWPGHGCYHLYCMLASAATKMQKCNAKQVCDDRFSCISMLH